MLSFGFRGSGCKKLGSKILERFLVLKPLREPWWGRRSCKNFALNFQGASRRKTAKKFLQKGWAAQGFKAKKRLKAEPADSPAG